MHHDPHPADLQRAQRLAILIAAFEESAEEHGDHFVCHNWPADPGAFAFDGIVYPPRIVEAVLKAHADWVEAERMAASAWRMETNPR